MSINELTVTDPDEDVRLAARLGWRKAIAVGLFLLGLGDVAVLDVVLLPRYWAERQSAPSGPSSPSSAPSAPTVEVVAPVIETPAPVQIVQKEPQVPSPPAAEPGVEPAPEVPALAPAAPVAEARPALPEPAPLLFKRDRVKLEKKVREELGGVLDVLRAQPDLHVVLIGHADDLGPSKVNRRLSARRARMVSYWLLNRGIDPERIEVVGRGAEEPVAEERTATARARNRRVEIDWRWVNKGDR